MTEGEVPEGDDSSRRVISGEEYLQRLGEEFSAFRQFLPGISDEAFEYQKQLASKGDRGVEGFMADFAISEEERRRDNERWKYGAGLPAATPDKEAQIRATLPRFAIPGREAIGGMSIEKTKSFRVDVVVEDIMTEVARRLPRRLDAYRFHQDYADDELEIPGIGKIKVNMHQSGDGIFTSISTLESPTFRIWNCRPSGVKYLNRNNDLSRPSEIKIKPKRLEIELYEDDSGIFVGLEGKRFTNGRWRTRFGHGYDSDSQRDELYRTWSGPNQMAGPDRGYQSNNGWEEDQTEHSWKEIEDQAIIWLVDNVLNPIRKTPLPEKQVNLPPREEPFPEDKVGPLFAFVEMRELERIVRIRDNPNRAYPDERAAVSPNPRLLPLYVDKQDLPEEVHDGYIWCGVGEISADMDISNIKIAKHERNTDSLLGRNEGLVEVKPLIAEDIYVIDWQEWDDYRKRTFKPGHDTLTDEEVAEMYRAVGKTFIPITKYKGGYKHPVVLIGRNLELDEIGEIIFPPEELGR